MRDSAVACRCLFILNSRYMGGAWYYYFFEKFCVKVTLIHFESVLLTSEILQVEYNLAVELLNRSRNLDELRTLYSLCLNFYCRIIRKLACVFNIFSVAHLYHYQ